MNKTIFISTPIYYASGDPHIGHAYTTLLADVLARYYRLLGHKVFMATGTDEFGQKIQTLAQRYNLSEQEFVDKNSAKFVDLFDKLGIEYDGFTRTTNPSHTNTVQKIFSKMLENGDIYLDMWKGYYCVSCEENYNPAQIIEKDCKKYCVVGHELIEKNEQSYFFKMSKYSDWINKYFDDNPDWIFPKHRAIELKNNFLNSLFDLSISRTTTTWGIKIKENPKHRIYVWLDALFNYLTILGYLSPNDDKYQSFWNNDNSERIHIMSKEITRFHCIYWPIFLHSLKINLPTKIYAHGWIITKEGKMSKSLGNVIDPFELIQKYGCDAVRYFFVKEIDLSRDSVFSNEYFVETINTDLANNIGNLVSRTIGMLTKYNYSTIPQYTGVVNELDSDIENQISDLINNLEINVKNFEINHISSKVIQLVKTANKYIEDYKPWELYNNNELKKLNSLLNHLCKIIQVICVIMSPILINGVRKIKEQMNFSNDILYLDSCLNMHSLDDIKVNKSEPIYQRFELIHNKNEK